MSASVRALLVVGLAIHLHLRSYFHGPPLDYAALGAASFASWFGVPGPGEPVLVASAVLAAKQKLSIDETLLVAFAGAVTGGIGGWVVGLKAGRRVVSRPGPLHRQRERALERGEEVFRSYMVVAILMTPSWIAGILRVRKSIYLVWNAVWAALWSVGIGLAAYFGGPPVIGAVGDLRYLSVIGVAGLVVAGVALEVGRRRRKHRPDSDQEPEAR